MDLTKIEGLLETMLEKQGSIVRMLNHIQLSLYSIDKGLEAAPKCLAESLDAKFDEIKKDLASLQTDCMDIKSPTDSH
ncbi:MAG: hypothetical protein LW629_06550 [Burkholderiales bacterium]|jgi:hypothetical protein|nr:hypothetical protein [Burkholderiales bacterium]